MQDDANICTAAVLLIGNELLSGRTKDVNLHFLATELTGMGITLRESRLVVDEEKEIISAVNALRNRYDYVFTTGGIGPTHDDITCESIAKAFNSPYVLNEEAKKILENYYESLGKELNESRLRMAHIPEGAALILNPISHAPGFIIGNVIVMAGIPSVMQAMFKNVAPELKKGNRVYSHSIELLMGEGDIAQSLREFQERYTSLDVGSYPFVKNDRYGTTLVLRGTDLSKLNIAKEELKNILVSLGVASAEISIISTGEQGP